MMNSLPPDLNAFVQASVTAGKYATADDVLAAGLRLLKARENYDEYVRRELHIGLAELERGEGRTFRSEQELEEFFEEVKLRGREALKAERRTSP